MTHSTLTRPAVLAPRIAAVDASPAGAMLARGGLARGLLARGLLPLQLALPLLLGAVFVAIGVATLAGTPEVLAQFGMIANATGIGGWLRPAIGLFEVVGGMLLFVRPTAGIGAVLLGVVMLGAVAADLLVLDTPPTVAAALFAGLVAVAYLERATLAVVGAFLEDNL